MVGIDPGLTGAMARFVNGRLTDIADIPNIVTQKPRKGANIRDLFGGGKATSNHTAIDKPALITLLREWVGNFSTTFCREDVHTMPRQGVVSSGKLMEVVGALDMAAAALGVPVHKVEPELWKRLMGCPTDKGEACLYAQTVFPEWASTFKRKSIDHNRAEAALIGLYGVRYAND